MIKTQAYSNVTPPTKRKLCSTLIANVMASIVHNLMYCSKELSMRRIMTVALSACIWLATSSSDLNAIQDKNKESAALPFSAARTSVSGQSARESSYSSINWDGKVYQASEAKPVLLDAIFDPSSDSSRQALALRELSTLRDRDVTSRLIALYDNVSDREVRLGILRCLIWSKDPNGFQLAARVLTHEKDRWIRGHAAVILAQWNIRQGVAATISLLEQCSADVMRDRAVCNQFADGFERHNIQQGWGFDQEGVRKSIDARTDIDDETKASLYIAAIGKWWAENEHRFPDWKLGDPLPPVDPASGDNPTPSAEPK